MPRYEFQCNKCKEVFETTMSVQDKETGKAACPKCNSKDLVQLYSGINIGTGKAVKKKSGGCCGGSGCCC